MSESFLSRHAKEIEMLSALETSALDRFLAAHNQSSEQTHRLTLLAAGIAGVVMPLLDAQTTGLWHPWFMRAAWTSFGVCVAIGVMINFAARYW